MNLGFPTKQIIEGKAKIIIPEVNTDNGGNIQSLRHKAPVFFNPVMKLNRDIAILVLSAFQEGSKKSLEVCDPLCGSGVRGVRLLLELEQISKVVMGDLNPTAIKLASANSKLNNTYERTSLRLLDANLLLSLHNFPGGRFDYVDIDPYGSPSPFINNGILSIKNHGLIALTATDLAPLCGVKINSCIRKYGGRPIRSEFCHEVAIRLLAGSVIKMAAVHEVSATPIFSYYGGHYIRLYARLEKGARLADQSVRKIGYIKYCAKCFHREISNDNKIEKCNFCGEFSDIAGPLWLGELAEKEFTKKMLGNLEKLKYLYNTKSDKIINKVFNEIGYSVGFFNIDNICSLVGIKSIPTVRAINNIQKNGYSVTLTHFDNRGIKTDANIIELKKIFSINY
jgi:tRNA (guanine26-N2/guanine27-N2)-dimethyltransferase